MREMQAIAYFDNQEKAVQIVVLKSRIDQSPIIYDTT